MCNKDSAESWDTALALKGIDRRQFALMSSAAALAACAPIDKTDTRDTLRENTVTVQTPDGNADAFFVRPAQGKHPAIVMWPDIAGLRDAYKIMARKLAASGYAVLVPNPYYRSAKAPVLTSLSQWFDPAMQAKLKPMMGLVDGAAVARDTSAYVAWLDTQAEVDTQRAMGTNGYCMGGAYAVRSAAAAPARIRAACSFHGARLVTTDADSPHVLMARTQAHYLFAIGQDDHAQHPEEQGILRAASGPDRPVEAEVYAADHGWCTIDSPKYDKVQADKAWSRMLATFKTAL